VQGALYNGIIKPNYGEYHIFTIVCGAGNHSVSDVRLKNFIKEKFLKKNNFDFGSDMTHGVHLICLKP
jgi:hypothetical protein